MTTLNVTPVVQWLSTLAQRVVSVYKLNCCIWSIIYSGPGVGPRVGQSVSTNAV